MYIEMYTSRIHRAGTVGLSVLVLVRSVTGRVYTHRYKGESLNTYRYYSIPLHCPPPKEMRPRIVNARQNEQRLNVVWPEPYNENHAKHNSANGQTPEEHKEGRR